MNKTNIATVTTSAAISIGQIILDDSNFLTLWGHIQKENTWFRCDFIITYEVFNTMLRYVQDRSDAVQMTIVQKLENMQQTPDLIDLEAELGDAVLFDNMQFQLTRPGHRENGDWVEYSGGECYYIESVTPPPAASIPRYIQKIDHCMEMLCKSYELYLGYIELEFEEDAARNKADLADDLKYTLAYYAWKERTL
jgi:hypothetical protein